MGLIVGNIYCEDQLSFRKAGTVGTLHGAYTDGVMGRQRMTEGRAEVRDMQWGSGAINPGKC